MPRRRQPRSPALSPRGTLRLRPSAAPRAAPRRSLPRGRSGERKHLPLSCPGPACARLRVARRAAALLCRGSAPRKSEPAALVSIAAFAETEVWWVGLNSGPPRRGPVYFFSFQNGSLQPRTSVRPVPGDAEREQALQRLQLQVTRRAAGPGGRGRPGCREPLSRDGAREASPQKGCPCRHVWPPEASGEGQGACPWLYQRRRSDLVTLSAEWDPGVPALGACLVIGQTWTLQALRLGPGCCTSRTSQRTGRGTGCDRAAAHVQSCRLASIPPSISWVSSLVCLVARIQSVLLRALAPEGAGENGVCKEAQVAVKEKRSRQLPGAETFSWPRQIGIQRQGS